jgi:hypothetical protein
LPHFVERSADTCHAALAKMTSAVGVPGPAPFTKSLPARVGKLKPSKADHRAKRIVSRWPSRTRSLIARGPPAGSSISAEAWRSWHRFGFIACPASKRRQLATVGAHARSSTRKSFFLWTGNSPRRGVGPDVAVCCSSAWERCSRATASSRVLNRMFRGSPFTLRRALWARRPRGSLHRPRGNTWRLIRTTTVVS